LWPWEFCFFLVTGPTQGASGGVWVLSSAKVDLLVADKAWATRWQVVGPNGRGAFPEDLMVDNGCHQIDGGVVKFVSKCNRAPNNQTLAPAISHRNRTELRE
jgi:hypothetical protein